MTHCLADVHHAIVNDHLLVIDSHQLQQVARSVATHLTQTDTPLTAGASSSHHGRRL